MSSITEARRRLQSLCGGCGNEPELGKSNCRKCLDKKRAYWEKQPVDRKKRKSLLGMLSAKRDSQAKVKSKAWRQRVKREVIAAYGGKCVCCSEFQIEFLTIDHKDGDGAAHRREVFNGRRRGSSTQFYCWLKKQGYPSNFQVLCFNCNCAKSDGAICPHQR
jgi:hypothetical protein